MKEKEFSSYENGLSTITIVNKYGTFTGHARLHEEDLPYESELAGCRFAEMKAGIKVFNAQIKQVRATIKTLEDFQKVLINCKDYNEHSCEARQLRKQIHINRKALRTLLAQKQSLTEKLHEHINYRDKVVRDMAQKKKGKNN